MAGAWPPPSAWTRSGEPALVHDRARPYGHREREPGVVLRRRAAGDLDAQVRRALELRDAGAALIDVVGELGATDRPPVSENEEAAWRCRWSSAWRGRG